MPEAGAKPTKPLCFVIGPIGKAGTDTRKHADMILHGVIKEVLERDELGYRVKRSDEDPRPGMISDRMIRDILDADLVVADLSELNPNAFYELGIRHLAEKPAIHIAKIGTEIPFDNFGHGAIFVDMGDWSSIIVARGQLFDAAKSIKEPDFQVSNPITQAKATIKLKESSDPNENLIAEMRDRIHDLERRTIYKSNRQNDLPLEYDSTNPAYAIVDKFNHRVAYIVKNAENEDAIHNEIFKLAQELRLQIKWIDSSSEQIRYFINDYFVEMNRSAAQWSTTYRP